MLDKIPKHEKWMYAGMMIVGFMWGLTELIQWWYF